MKPTHAIFLPVLFCLSQAFGQTKVKKHRLSIEASIGAVTSDLLNNPSDISWCFECWSSIEQIPVTNPQWNLGLQFKVGARNYIAAGFANHKLAIKERTPIFGSPTGEYYTETIGFKFYGINFMHRFIILKGQQTSLSIGNGVQYDRYIKQIGGYANVDLKDHNFSYIGKLEVAKQFGKWHELTFSPLFRLALRPYNEYKYSDKYLPFGYGLMLGWRIKLG